MNVVKTFGLLTFLWIAAASAAAAPASSKSAILNISAFKICDKAGVPHLEMDAKGTLSVDGRVLGKLKSDGEVSDAQGKAIARLRPNGQLVDGKGNVLTTVKPDGTVKFDPDQVLSWNADGSLMKGAEVGDMKLQPADSPARRAASVMIFLYFGGLNVKTEELK